MESILTIALSLGVIWLLQRAFRNVLARQPNLSARDKGRAVIFGFLAVSMAVAFFLYYGMSHLWFIPILLLSVGGLVTTAIDFWRGTWHIPPQP